jgi:hypothetical protein
LLIYKIPDDVTLNNNLSNIDVVDENEHKISAIDALHLQFLLYWQLKQKKGRLFSPPPKFREYTVAINPTMLSL